MIPYAYLAPKVVFDVIFLQAARGVVTDQLGQALDTHDGSRCACSVRTMRLITMMVEGVQESPMQPIRPR